jgi:hypothetical protein
MRKGFCRRVHLFRQNAIRSELHLKSRVFLNLGLATLQLRYWKETAALVAESYRIV